MEVSHRSAPAGAAVRGEHVLSAVQALLAREGLQGLSVRARRRGGAAVSPAQVQYYFRTRDELVAGAYLQAVRQSLADLPETGDVPASLPVLREMVWRWLPLDDDRRRPLADVARLLRLCCRHARRCGSTGRASTPSCRAWLTDLLRVAGRAGRAAEGVVAGGPRRPAAGAPRRADHPAAPPLPPERGATAWPSRSWGTFPGRGCARWAHDRGDAAGAGRRSRSWTAPASGPLVIPPRAAAPPAGPSVPRAALPRHHRGLLPARRARPARRRRPAGGGLLGSSALSSTPGPTSCSRSSGWRWSSSASGSTRAPWLVGGPAGAAGRAAPSAGAPRPRAPGRRRGAPRCSWLSGAGLVEVASMLPTSPPSGSSPPPARRRGLPPRSPSPATSR